MVCSAADSWCISSKRYTTISMAQSKEALQAEGEKTIYSLLSDMDKYFADLGCEFSSHKFNRSGVTEEKTDHGGSTSSFPFPKFSDFVFTKTSSKTINYVFGRDRSKPLRSLCERHLLQQEQDCSTLFFYKSVSSKKCQQKVSSLRYSRVRDFF